MHKMMVIGTVAVAGLGAYAYSQFEAGVAPQESAAAGMIRPAVAAAATPMRVEPAGPAALYQLAAEVAADEKILGQPDAPVTIIEYSSLTCPHCAAFHEETLPTLKETYIETGKVRLIIRDFPFDRFGLQAAMTAHCLPENQYFGFVDLLFEKQSVWSRASDPLASIQQIARFAGMTEQAFQDCLNDEALMDRILQRRQDGAKQFEIGSTPTFLINGKKLVGNQPLDTFKDMIEAALAESS